MVKLGLTCYFTPERKKQLELLSRLSGESQATLVERAVAALLDKNAVSIKFASDALDGLALDIT